MSLTDYQRKRDFTRTSEPRAKVATKPGSQFVIQKHAASHLHYDFRLEMDGVLKSWAVPHGPSLDPAQKRLAVQVEDHPLAYATFEGTIPAGEYGGGTVMVWDRGTWSAVGDAEAGYREGKLKIDLNGEKLHGGWTLVRMRPREGEKSRNWLLIKERDAEAVPSSESDILESRPESAATGRSLEEIGGQATAKKVGREGKTPVSKSKPRKSAAVKTGSADSHDGDRLTPTLESKPKAKKQGRVPAGAIKAPMPEVVDPELATLVSKPPEGQDWLHEAKFDGYRIHCHLKQGQVILRSRSQLDWTHRFPEIAKALQQLKVRQAILDGEIVAPGKNGTTSFQDLQLALSESKTADLKYYVFDLLYHDGYDLRGLPLEERRRRLLELVGKGAGPRIQISEELRGDGDKAFKECEKRGWEGIVSKRRDSVYRGGRAGQWVKAKQSQRDEFVIGGFTDSTSTRKLLGALLLGYYDNQGKLVYAGKVGTGFSEIILGELHSALTPLEQKRCPFLASSNPETTSHTHWVKPELVAQIAYSNLTRDGRLRHSVFHGLREDKPAKAVMRDTPQEIESDVPPEPALAADSQSSKPAKKVKVAAAPKRSRTTKSVATKEQTTSDVSSPELTHPDRVMYPDAGFTKRQVATYYAEVVDWILPHLTGRPLSLVRCPEGVGGQTFYQKHASPGVSRAIEQISIKEKDKTDTYLIVNDLEGLLSLVQMGVLEIHPWGARKDDLDRPDRIVFDLDPDPSVGWAKVVTAAVQLRQRLQDLGWESFVKTTGGKGLHVVVPLARRNAWAEVKAFSKAIANQICADAPSEFTTNISKAARPGKIFIDYLRNDRGSTAVAAYSTRARPGAPVATPVAWDELSPSLKPSDFRLDTVPRRLAALKEDPWSELFEIKQSLTAAVKRKAGL